MFGAAREADRVSRLFEADPCIDPYSLNRTWESGNKDQNMANIKSQKKRILTNAKAYERNKAVRAEVRTRVKSAEASGEVDGEATRAAIARIDRVAAKGVIHKNTAARKKSRLIKHLQSVQA